MSAPTLVLLPKGRLEVGAMAALAAAGYAPRFEGRSLRSAPCRGVTFLRGKPRAAPQLLALGLLAGALVGRDVLEDAAEPGVRAAADLFAPVGGPGGGLAPVGAVAVVAAVPAGGAAVLDRPPPRPLRIATEYPGLTSRWARARGLAHVVLRAHGSTEGYAPDLADVVVDCVETGATLAANGLEAVETVLPFAGACLAVRGDPEGPVADLAGALRGSAWDAPPCGDPAAYAAFFRWLYAGGREEQWSRWSAETMREEARWALARRLEAVSAARAALAGEERALAEMLALLGRCG